jgi:hypothetical protein
VAGLIDPPVPALAVTVYFFNLNVALTLQAAVTAPVVYVFPLSDPAQPLTLSISNPGFAITAKFVVDPRFTGTELGEIAPPAPADAVTTNVSMKDAVTSHAPVTGPVV